MTNEKRVWLALKGNETSLRLSEADGWEVHEVAKAAAPNSPEDIRQSMDLLQQINRESLSSKTVTLDFALKIADSHAKVTDVLEYRALAVLAAAVRAAQIHTADQCSAHETSDVENLRNAVAAMRSTRDEMQRRLIEQDGEIEKLRAELAEAKAAFNLMCKIHTPSPEEPTPELCALTDGVIHCRCGNPSSHYGTMVVRGAREVRESPVKASGHPVIPCIYRDGCRKFPACMTEDRCCGSDPSIPKTR